MQEINCLYPLYSFFSSYHLQVDSFLDDLTRLHYKDIGADYIEIYQTWMLYNKDVHESPYKHQKYSNC